MASAPIFYNTVIDWTYNVVLYVTLAIELFALVHCVTRKPAGFLAVGNVPKIGWVAMVGGSFLFSLLAAGSRATIIGGGGDGLGILTLVALAAFIVTLIYLLDVRPALRDATNGRGSW